VIAPCNVACGSGIVTVHSPRCSTLQCDTWLWDDMVLNSAGGSTLHFFAFWRQTDEQMDSTDALSRSRYGEQRLNKSTIWLQRESAVRKKSYLVSRIRTRIYN